MCSPLVSRRKMRGLLDLYSFLCYITSYRSRWLPVNRGTIRTSNMDNQEYLELSEVTERKFPDGLTLNQSSAETLHAVMGLVTESGELMDAVKKHIIYGAELDMVNVKEELGDLFWYVAMLIRELGGAEMYSEIQTTNIKKLEARFGGKFSEFRAMNRDLDTEREVLEAGELEGAEGDRPGC